MSEAPLALLSDMKDPLLHVMSNETLVVIEDKFPKAKFHFLVLPKENIRSIFELNKSHISLLDDMYLMARQLIWKKEMSKDSFKIGFHALPSKQQLHLHVISKDFDSDCLRSVTIWNGFNTDYFIPLHDLQSELEKRGKIRRISDSKAKWFLSTPLKCNSCDAKPKNIPDLKKHLKTHVGLYQKWSVLPSFTSTDK